MYTYFWQMLNCVVKNKDSMARQSLNPSSTIDMTGAKIFCSSDSLSTCGGSDNTCLLELFED